MSTWPFNIVGELDEMVPGRVLAENGELAPALLVLTPTGNKGWDTGIGMEVDMPGWPPWNGCWIPGAVVVVTGAATFWTGNSGWCGAKAAGTGGTGKAGGYQGWGRPAASQVGGWIPIWAGL